MNDSSAPAPVEVPVVCSVCHSRLSAPLSLVGKTIVCPDCHTTNRVVAPPPPVPTPKPQYTGDEYQLRDETSSSPPTPPADLVRLLCSRCSTLMYARVEHVGRKLKCPDCGTVNTIPKPGPAPAPFQTPDIRDLKLDTAPPPSADLKRKEIADRLMAEAMEHVKRKDATKPKPPSNPMKSGVYSFLIYPSTIPLWAILGIGLTGCLAIWQLVVSVMNQGIASVMAAFLMPILSILTVGLLGLVAPHFLTVIEHTADGYDRMPNWPSQDLLSRGRALWFWLNALAMSTAPGMMLVGLIRLTGVPLPNLFGLVSTMVLFPIVTISLLLNNSIFLFYSPLVLHSVSRHRTAWLSFYVQTIGMAAAIVLLTVSLLWAQDEPSLAMDLIVFLVVSMYAVVYCRLLGRLGWIFSQDPEMAAAWEEHHAPDDDEQARGDAGSDDDEELSEEEQKLRSVTRPRA